MTPDDDPEDEYRERRDRPGREDHPLTRNDFRTPSAKVGRTPSPGGHDRYALIVNGDEIAVSAHLPFDEPGRLMLASYNERGDFRPIRLTAAEARALRDGLNLFLADHQAPNPERG